MAFDGITIANIIQECRQNLIGGRIYKIAQPESDELLITFKTAGGQSRLMLSADASLPLIYLTEENKPSPMTAPNFCMLLRKHLQNGRIVEITQPGLERIMRIEIEHLNELGDLCHKYLITEIMGKHSNIIFTDDQDRIIDSIKHISSAVSSVREVLPGKDYFIPKTTAKTDPVDYLHHPDASLFSQLIFSQSLPLFRAFYSAFTGISPVLAQELCYRSSLDANRPASSFSGEEALRFHEIFLDLMSGIQKGSFSPNIVYENHIPAEYASVPLTMYHASQRKDFDSISALLKNYYAEKNAMMRIRQKSAELRHIVQTALERTVKKYDLQCTQIKDTEKRENYRIYGELLHTYGYQAVPSSKSLEAVNYYNGETVVIPLDPQKSPSENAKRYFDKYTKMKRTYETLSVLIQNVRAEITHLESISTSLDIAEQESDLAEIREELTASGYLRRKGTSKKVKITSRPFHYQSSDGFDIFVGRNNYQNDALTFQLAVGNDWWFHAKGIPGSHVIVRSNGKELPDRTYEEAARLAAHYSSARGQSRVEIDYTEKKNVKKPAAAKPGFVIYHTNFSMVMNSDISGISQITE
jgi:predicted ribosome quality control (RQC) complex YloA/Tae2 family protein